MEANLPQETTPRSNSERITAIEATLPHLATKADLERHTRLLIMWLRRHADCAICRSFRRAIAFPGLMLPSPRPSPSCLDGQCLRDLRDLW